ncbi:hypothetical protein MTO96_033607 [Rhipicephalus appendiculatus]
MLGFEAEVLDPLLELYSKTPAIYVYERDSYDASGMWERWMVTLASHYKMTRNELVTISTLHREYFHRVLELIAEKEAVVELVIGWLCVQYTSWFANRQLISNIYANRVDIVEYHRKACFVFTLVKMGVALFVPFVQSVYTQPVREDAARITRDVRRTVYQTLERVTYPWSELGPVFHLLDTAVAHDIDARFSRYPDMEASFIKNVRDVTRAAYRTDRETTGLAIPRFVLADNLYEFITYPDRFDYMLKPSILTPPLYHVTAPMPVRLGAFGVEVAEANIRLYAHLWFEGHSTRQLDVFQDCFYGAINKEASLARVSHPFMYG